MDRTSWHDLPSAVRRAAERHTGPVARAETASHGVMSRLACTVHTRSGRQFVKGTRLDDPSAWVYRHEAQATLHAPLAPRVLWDVEAAGWLLIGYEYVDGRHPDLSPGSPDVTSLVRTLTAVSEVPWPETLRKKPLHTRWVDFLPDGIPAGLQGRSLAHTDLSPLNMLVTADDRLRLLDWALACPAPAWADTAFAVLRLISSGHTPEQAEAVARQVPAYRQADPSDVGAFARTVLAAWADMERAAPLPHRAALTAAARSWAAHRGPIRA
ncbi:phosphotransferase [Streptomyces alboflavus]|uniref:phosphotransferase n=1 Tax=Streptomyces alboflavus TaxID=67267 RepID=UPI00068F571F|nr:phosphotransferase [Streptomyces alboflavus]